ncbi:uracil-DNA glycosylase family protein [Cereibacter changlensis]|jgi:uracil-DNA glycosylase|uniref:Uracil-DNA glycosylase family protein n=1 Tax=Cereibacter changlensis TaxID=402884 RepID=A0A4U0YZ49_9RHOB|nr:uracil-DNA glycosylase family protein [Cereibacter changlensis]TKA97175.1 uracil-DNA glycosylase family protein [Cereibacter changlensis]
MNRPNALSDAIEACRLCAPRFAATATAHEPRPVPWFRASARLLIAGQAPGARVQAIGEPFRDASGDRLRLWTGLSEAEFYDRERVAIVPMAFCFPGYDAKGSDLPPPPICARTWHAQVMHTLCRRELTLVVGGAAQRWHLGTRSVTETVADWRAHLAQSRAFPLPHPSWRTTGWLKRHPWFETELLPALRAEVRAVMEMT